MVYILLANIFCAAAFALACFYYNTLALAAKTEECASAIRELQKEAKAFKMITAELREAEMSCYRQMCTMGDRVSKCDEICRELSDSTVFFKHRASALDRYIKQCRSKMSDAAVGTL